MEAVDKNTKILFLFPKSASAEEQLIRANQAPSERLYGYFEMKEQGYSVQACDHEFNSKFRGALNFFRRLGVRLPTLVTLLKVSRCEVLVIKDDFFTLAAVAAKILRKKLIYKDSLFDVPTRAHRKLIAAINLWLADIVIAYSNAQIELWRQEFPRYKKKFQFLHYPIDINFYRTRSHEVITEKDSFISVGRDLGRDNQTLVAATMLADVNLDLVTLPYLVPEEARLTSSIRVHQYLSYDELFELYADSFCAVIPLKKNIVYPSGIRALMEAIALGVPVICAQTVVLSEYFYETRGLLFYQPGNASELADKVTQCKLQFGQGQAVKSDAKEQLSAYSIEDYYLKFISVISR